MDEKLIEALGQESGQCLGEQSVALMAAVIAVAVAISKQPGIDRDKFFADVITQIPATSASSDPTEPDLKHTILDTLKELLTKIASGK